MSDLKQHKAELRRVLRQQRAQLTKQQQRAAATGLLRSVSNLGAWHHARSVALYLSNDGEIDTKPLAQHARAMGKEVFLPVIRPDKSLSFALWRPQDQLQNNRYDIPEPLPGARRCKLAELDILFLPLVGWDRQGGRLGMGGGFYDRALAASAQPLLVGLAHECQRLESVPMTERDVSMHCIATDASLHYCRKNDV